jgi:hypothetical protein
MLHLARHMEEIALGVLSHGGEEFEDNSQGSESSESLGQRNLPPFSFPCQECVDTFETRHDLDAHVIATHHGSGKHSNTELDIVHPLFPEPGEPSNTSPGADVSWPGPTRDYNLDLADPKRTQKVPTAYQCIHCPKTFTRFYNLESHLRTHTERPFVCNGCGRAFARMNERKRHEGLHAREGKIVCGGKLKDGNDWGCGRRFARLDILRAHYRAKKGQMCIRPLLEEEGDSGMGDKERQSLPAIISAHVLDLGNIDEDLPFKLEDELEGELDDELSQTPNAKAPLD